MLPSDDRTRLQHMLDATERITRFAEGKTREDLDSDEQLALSLVRLLEIIGEAAKCVSQGVRKANPGIEWKGIAGTRDRLIHGYFDVDLDIVWSIVQDDLPVLTKQLCDILEHDG